MPQVPLAVQPLGINTQGDEMTNQMAEDIWKELSKEGLMLSPEHVVEIGELAEKYLQSEAAEVGEDGIISRLKSLWELSKKPEAKISKKDAKLVQKLIISAFSKVSTVERLNKDNKAGKKTGGPNRLFDVMGHHASEEKIMKARFDKKTVAGLLKGAKDSAAEASSAFDKLKIADEEDRADMLSKIGLAQKKAGLDSDGSFIGAASAAHKIEADGRWTHIMNISLSNIASDYAKAGLFEKALSLADEIKDMKVYTADVYQRSKALLEIASEQAKAGFPDKAISTAKLITADYPRSLAFTNIALAQIELGTDPSYCLKEALQAASNMHDIHNRAPYVAMRVEAFSKVAIAQARAGVDFSIAIKQAGDLTKSLESFATGDFSYEEALSDFALAQAECGLFSEALASVGKIRQNPHAIHVEAFAKIGAIQSKSDHDSSEAFKLAFAAADVYKGGMRSVALEMISSAQAEAGMLDQAHATTDKMGDAFCRSRALSTIGIAETKKGIGPSQTFKQAFAAAEELSGPSRVYSFANIASAQGDAANFAAV